MQKVSDEIRAVSDETGAGVADLSESVYQAISAGVDAGHAVGFVKDMTIAAKAGFTDTTTAVNGVTTVLNAYGKSAEEATAVTDQLLLAQNFDKTSFGEMAEAMGHVIPIAAHLNVSTQELFGSIAVLTKNGIRTSEAITGLKAAYSNILKPSAEGAKLAQSLGLEFNAVHLQSVGWVKFLDEVKRATGGDAQQMAQLFGSVEGLNIILVLTGKGAGDFDKVMDQMAKSAGMTREAYEKMLTTSEQMQIAMNQLKNAGMDLAVSFTPQIIGSVSSLERSGSISQNLASETKVALGYAFQTRVKAAEGWISGKATISGTLKNGMICGDAVITATEAMPIPTDITVPAGYTPVYLYQNRLYTDRSLNSPLTSKSQIASGSSLYVADLFHDSTSLENLLTPSKDNMAGVGCDEICVDLSNITKSNITNLGSVFLGNSNLESADLNGFCDIDTIYSLFAYCTNLKCVYFDTLCNVGKGELNTYHTLSTCKNLEYLVLDNVSVNFIVENVNDVERGIPAGTKILVSRAALDAYKADSHWSSAADRILAMEDFDIVRKDGVVTVTPKAV